MPKPYLPPAWLHNRWLQTGLASLRLRARHTGNVLRPSRRRILTTTKGVRLLGFDLPHPAPRGRVVLIHGWEGSSDSTYVRITAATLHQAGYNVFRLNLRDHGPSHHLNEGVFLAIYLDEVVEAVTRLAAEVPYLSVALCGFSLGGNFALRIAGRWGPEPPVNLRQVVAVSPAIDPIHSTESIDRHPALLWYFRRKWRRSLRRKQALFPHRYDFSDISPHMNLMEMTERLISRVSAYPDARTYLSAYAVTPAIYQQIRVPTAVITALDDPVIPVADLMALPENPSVERIIHAHGGHNGFLEAGLGTWYEGWLVQRLGMREPFQDQATRRETCKAPFCTI